MLFALMAVAAAFSIQARISHPFPGDTSLILWVQSWQHPAVTSFMETVTMIGGGWPPVGLGGVAAVGLFLFRLRREALFAVGALAIMGLNPLLKLLVDQPRPPADLVIVSHTPGGLGFPSGHAFQSLVLFGILIYLASIFISGTWLRRFVQASLVLFILVIGLSRVYLGVHWPSDVLGGYLFGGVFLALLLRGYRTSAPAAAIQ